MEITKEVLIKVFEKKAKENSIPIYKVIRDITQFGFCIGDELINIYNTYNNNRVSSNECFINFGAFQYQLTEEEYNPLSLLWNQLKIKHDSKLIEFALEDVQSRVVLFEKTKNDKGAKNK
jgi:hypothetical protein